MKLFVFILAIFMLVPVATSQEPSSLANSELKGTVRSVVYERTYLIRKRIHVDPAPMQIYLELYDAGGFEKQFSTFGTGEMRTVFEKSGNVLNAKVLYFDKHGNPSVENSFDPSINDILESGLCSQFTVVAQDDKKGKVRRRIESCPDGAIRARETYEYDEKDRVVRYFREDAKSRSWAQSSVYDDLGYLIEFRHAVDDTEHPKYTQIVQYTQYKFDAQKNWIEAIGSAFDSRRPGELIHQFIEQRKVTYFEK